ncbi:MAG TPA: hypothetical protein VF755_13485, partial [Catenuloplanes sp.]
LIRTHWPVLLAAVLAAVAVRLAAPVWRARVWRQHAAQARWLEITPPVSATPAATVALWRLLATVLPAPRRWALRPPRLIWEVQADPKGMRCGMWLPPGVNPTAVQRALQRAWPGALARQRPAPAFAPGEAVAAMALRPTQPEWLPLVEDPSPPRTPRHFDAPPTDEDRLRAVYDGLAAAGRTGGGLLQVHITRAPGHRLATLRRATVNPNRARRARGAARVATALANGLRALLLGVIDVLTPGSSGTKHAAQRNDPYTAELARQARTKLAAAPHLLIAVRATASGPTVAAAQAAAADITSGFGLLSAHFTRRRLRRPFTVATWRWVPDAGMTLASVEETAALAGLPAEPAAHGLPAAASRRRPISRDVFNAGPVPTTPRTSGTPTQPPTAWSTP